MISPRDSLWFVVFVCASLRAQDVVTLRSDVRVVLLDVVVSTSKGHPVEGLHKDDFEIIEDGKRQTILSFEEHKGEPPAPEKLPPMPSNVFTNYPAMKPPESVNVLLLDWLNTQPQDQATVYAQTVQYLKQVPPGTHLAIFTLGVQLHMVQGFTTDLADLLSSLTGKNSRPGASPLLPTSAKKAAEDELLSLMVMNRAAPAAIEAARQEMDVTSASETGKRITLTLEGLQQLARYLSSIPGRKNVIWFAGSFPVRMFPKAGVPSQSQPDIRHTAEMLSPDRIAIYPISASGLSADSRYSPEYQNGGPSLSEEFQSRAANQVAMEELAYNTGGHAFFNTNGLGATMARIINDDTRFYTLSYAPANKKLDGTFRDIRVKLSSGDYKLTYRRGYYAEDAKERNVAERPLTVDPLLSLMGFGLPDFAQVLYKARVLPLDPQPAKSAPPAGSNTELKGPLTRYKVDFAISLDDLKLEKGPDGFRHAIVEVMLIAYDRDGRPLNLTKERGEAKLTPRLYEEARRVGFQVHKEIDIPSGYAYLRTGVYDWNSRKAGTLGIPLRPSTVPIPR